MRTILSVISILLNFYYMILLLRVLVSWLRLDPYHPVRRFLDALTEPILQPIRAILPTTGMIDFSPLVAILIVFALQQVLSILADGL